MNYRASYSLVSGDLDVETLSGLVGMPADRVVEAGAVVGGITAHHSLIAYEVEANDGESALERLLDRLSPIAERLSLAAERVGDEGLSRVTLTGFAPDTVGFRVPLAEMRRIVEMGAELWCDGYLTGGDLYLVSRWEEIDGEPDGEPVAVASDREGAYEIGERIVADGAVAQIARVGLDEIDGIRRCGWIWSDGTRSMVGPWD